MIAITGAAGFIGWNLYLKLRDHHEVILVDFPEKFEKEFTPDCMVMDPFAFVEKLKSPLFASKFTTIYHQGACSDTMNYNVKYMMRHNFDYSHDLLHRCMENSINLIYASSAAIYGIGRTTPLYEDMQCFPRNIYAKSKKIFDDYALTFIDKSESQIVGLRYFNVYGPWEHRKNKMSSVVNQFKKQIDSDKKIKIFEKSNKYFRDFVYVDDVISVNTHFGENEKISGIFNCGSGEAKPFSDIPKHLAKHYNFEIEEIKMPKKLEDKYQKYTQANLNRLTHMGRYRAPMLSLKEGIQRYVEFWEK